jgi:hypothetical protein
MHAAEVVIREVECLVLAVSLSANHQPPKGV